MEERLQKYLSECGVMSRRAAEKEIAAGRIMVNGKAAETGCVIDPETDRVTYNGREIKKDVKSPRAYIMLNKPRGYVTTLSDEKKRPCVTDLIADLGVRVWPCGRLDLDSEGLLILTNDGELTNRMTHPRHGIAKIYHVKITGEITPDKLSELKSLRELDDGTIIRPVDITVVSRSEGVTTLRMELHEGKNRQIRRMCELCGIDILRLQRIAIGDLSLGDLRPGKWRRLTSSQITYLKGAMTDYGKKTN